MTPRKKKKYLTDERIDKEIRKLGVVFCPSCKSEKVFSGMSVNREIDTDMFRLEVSYSCKEAIGSSRLIIFVDNLDDLYNELPPKEGGSE